VTVRRILIAVNAIVLLAACADADVPASPTPQVSTTTTVTTVTAEPTTTTLAAESAAATTTTSTTTTTVPRRPLEEIALELREAGSGFTQPVLMLTPPEDDRWFVVDQPGIVWVIGNGEALRFLDISDLVTFRGEQGLLGLAFHPDFVANGLVYLNYIDNGGDSVVASVLAEGNTADRDSLTEIMRVDQPAGNHNGGMIQFGPDGNLWIGFGDGGGADDQFGQGQRADTMLGSMLRITVGADIDGYTVPDGNLDGTVWATGLRNPWRFDFDGDILWIADVGQNRIEEVDALDWSAGNPNFGWSIMEGTECFGGDDCDSTGLTLPVYEYSHGEGCSVTGGFAYRGDRTPELNGHFFFADYCTGWLRSVDSSGNAVEWLPAGTLSRPIGFGEDAAGELYVLTADGVIWEIGEAG